MRRREALLSFGAFASRAFSAPLQVYRPRLLAHLCNWHELGPRNSWGETSMQPVEGPYDSRDPAVLERKLAAMRLAGLGPLVSWWGPDHPAGDVFLELLVSVPGTDVPAAVLYEGAGRLRESGGVYDFNDYRNRSRFRDDLRHLCDRWFARYPERFFREEGRFVLVCWPSHVYRGDFRSLGQEVMAELPLYLVGTDVLTRPFVRPDASDVVGGFAAESAYGIYLSEVAHELGGILDRRWLDRWQAMADAWDRWLAVHEPQVKLVLPLQFAFDDTKVPGRSNPVLVPAEGAPEELLRRVAGIMEDSRRRAGRYLDWGLLASYDEYFEGTSVEPNTRYGSRFFDLVRAVFGAR